MSYEQNGIQVEVSNLDGISDPIIVNDGVYVHDELIALKEAYFSGEVDPSEVRAFFEKFVTIGAEKEADARKAFKPAGVNGKGTRPLFQIKPKRITTGAQPFCFYFQNWEDVLAP